MVKETPRFECERAGCDWNIASTPENLAIARDHEASDSIHLETIKGEQVPGLPDEYSLYHVILHSIASSEIIESNVGPSRILIAMRRIRAEMKSAETAKNNP